MGDVINVIQCGLGPIGLGVTREIVTRKNLRIVGAVDADQRLAGKDIGELAGLGRPLGLAVVGDVNEVLDKNADVAVVTTASAAEAVAKHMDPFLKNHLHVVTSCEELAYAFRTKSKTCSLIDQVAKQNGVAVLATGVNPGFLMDYLPLASTAILRRVDQMTVERIQDAAKRRIPFIKKVGAGMSVEEFRRKVDEGVLRHVGLTESMHMIADKLGWALSRMIETIDPVIAQKAWSGQGMSVPVGHCLGVEQFGRGFDESGREVLTLHFRATVGEENARDAIRTEGDPPFHLVIPGGVNGDSATIAIIVNAISAIVDAEPGLRHMADGPLVVCR